MDETTLWNLLVARCKERNIPLMALHRLVDPMEFRTRDEMLDVLVRNYKPTQNLLRVGETLLKMEYKPLPPRETLEKQFGGKGSVSIVYDGRQFFPHPSRADSQSNDGDRGLVIYCVKTIAIAQSTEVIIESMRHDGYMPATEKELLAYISYTPFAGIPYPLVALGSFAIDDENAFYPTFDCNWTNNNNFIEKLSALRVNEVWTPAFSFLCVRPHIG